MKEPRDDRGGSGSDSDDDRKPPADPSGGARSPGKRKRAPEEATSYEKKWAEMFERLKTFKEKHGHCRVPNRYDDDPALGYWVSTQRRQYRILSTAGSESVPLTAKRAKLLVDLGFEWSAKDPTHKSWAGRYEELCAFKEKYGHAQVPMGWEENPRLATWVSTQRQEYKMLQQGRSSRLTQNKIKQLNDVGFVWEAQRGRKKHKSEESVDPASTVSESAGGVDTAGSQKEEGSPSAASRSNRAAAAAIDTGPSAARAPTSREITQPPFDDDDDIGNVNNLLRQGGSTAATTTTTNTRAGFATSQAEAGAGAMMPQFSRPNNSAVDMHGAGQASRPPWITGQPFQQFQQQQQQASTVANPNPTGMAASGGSAIDAQSVLLENLRGRLAANPQFGSGYLGPLPTGGASGVQQGNEYSRLVNLLQQRNNPSQVPTGASGGSFPASFQNFSNIYDVARTRTTATTQDQLLNQTLLQQIIESTNLQQQQQQQLLLDALRSRSASLPPPSNILQAMGYSFPQSLTLGRPAIGPSLGDEHQSLALALGGVQQQQQQQQQQQHQQQQGQFQSPLTTLEALRRYQQGIGEQKDAAESSVARMPQVHGPQASSSTTTSPSSTDGNDNVGGGGKSEAA